LLPFDLESGSVSSPSSSGITWPQVWHFSPAFGGLGRLASTVVFAPGEAAAAAAGSAGGFLPALCAAASAARSATTAAPGEVELSIWDFCVVMIGVLCFADQ
jgi:hypothetical protein